jgi:hypothetical protein
MRIRHPTCVRVGWRHEHANPRLNGLVLSDLTDRLVGSYRFQTAPRSVQKEVLWGAGT